MALENRFDEPHWPPRASSRASLRATPRAPLRNCPRLVLLCSGVSFGQLSDAAKKAPNADAAAIQRHVDAAVKNLSSDDAEKQAKGRDDIAGGVVLADPAAMPSPVFLDAYAAAVAKALTPLAQHADMRVRLNAAIANARVAERAGNTRLMDLTVRFINDKTSAVALWGVKAARSMLPTVLGLGQNNNPLLAALAQAVQRVGFGPIVTEVYDALSLNIVQANPKPPPNVVKGAAGEMLRVFRIRVNGYAGGVPPDPAVDNVASEFFSFSVVWQQLTPPQRVEAVQAMADLLSLAAQHSQFMEGEDRQVLMPIFKRTGARPPGDRRRAEERPVSTAAKEVTRISSGMDGTEIISKSRRAVGGAAEGGARGEALAQAAPAARRRR